jgi:hypothetical protein
MLAKAKLASSITFIVLASFMIVTYDRQNIFMVQTTVGRNSSLDKTSFIAIGLGFDHKLNLSNLKS